MSERRAVQRVEPSESLPAKVKTFLPARILDISSQGAQVELASCLRPQVTCDVKITVPGGDIVLRAMIRRCRAWGFGVDEKDQRVLLYRAGLEFEELSPEALARLAGNVLYDAPADSPPPAAEAEAAVGVATAPQQPTELPAAPRREGPVKIRISSEQVRRIMTGAGD